jgi:hypothetical protein
VLAWTFGLLISPSARGRILRTGVSTELSGPRDCDRFGDAPRGRVAGGATGSMFCADFLPPFTAFEADAQANRIAVHIVIAIVRSSDCQPCCPSGDCRLPFRIPMTKDKLTITESQCGTS